MNKIFQKRRGTALFDFGSVNVPVAVDACIGEAFENASLVYQNKVIATTHIDRNANPNGTARLIFGRALSTILSTHYSNCEYVSFAILSRNQIELL